MEYQSQNDSELRLLLCHHYLRCVTNCTKEKTSKIMGVLYVDKLQSRKGRERERGGREGGRAREN